MIKITVMDVDQAIKIRKGTLSALGTKWAQRAGIIDPVKLAERKIVQKVQETLEKEGIIAKVEIDSE